jgi:Flp pilus assembly protein TadD
MPSTDQDFKLTDDELLQAGFTVIQSGKVDLAEKLFRGSIALNGQNPHSLSNLGVMLAKSGRIEEAREYLVRAIATSPSHAAAWCMLGLVYNEKQQFLDARLCIERAIEIEPRADFYYNLAGQWQCALNWQKSEECYVQALKLRPEDASARYAWGIIKMLQGDWAYGLPLYEARLQEDTSPKGVTPANQIFEQWSGKESDCVAVIVEAEQGIGDLFQMSRYAIVLQELFPNAVMVLHCAPGLVGIMKRFDGWHDVVSQEDKIASPSATIRVAAMSLPYLCQLYGKDIFQPPAKINMKDLPEVGKVGNNKIGICWAGNPGHKMDRFRSLSYETFREALVLGPSRHLLDQVTVLQYNGQHRYMETWENTLATLAQLDIVITCDTAVAHLAASMGKPVWMMTAAWPDWRWGTSSETTPWYPSMQIFRQEKLLQWQPVIDKIRELLSRMG